MGDKKGLLGMGVDSDGGPVVDPTANVIALTEAGNRRQDDLRAANDTLVKAELRHVGEMAALREIHQREIREIETKRLDAIRQVDVLAVTTAAERANEAIQRLATATASNAENLRLALTSTASTIATQTAQTVGAIIERISALEKAYYEGKGKEQISDPLLTKLVAEVTALRESGSGSVGRSEGTKAMWGYVVGAVSFILMVLTIVFTIYNQVRAQ